jgi:predicted 3-demethylubiquinone-9 3-methyltransferase (glyoxalase superfamily)
MVQGGHAEKAVNLYVSLLDDGEVLDATRLQKGEQGAEGSIKLAREQERLFAKLSDGGEMLMPLDDYGFSKRFAWVADRFGVCWQLNLA